MPRNSKYRLPRGHRFQPKLDITVMAPNHRWDSLGSILGTMGSHWVKKMGQNRNKLPCPKIRNFDYPAVIDFRPKFDFMVMAPNHSGDTLGSILRPIGSHWVQKMGQNCKILPFPKIWIFDYPALIDFDQNWFYGFGVKSPMGKKLPCPKIRNFDYPAVIDFDQNSTLWLWRQITVWTP